MSLISTKNLDILRFLLNYVLNLNFQLLKTQLTFNSVKSLILEKNKKETYVELLINRIINAYTSGSNQS